MVEPMLRTRSKKRKLIRTPGNRLVTHYKEEKPGAAKCAICKKPLHGVPRVITSEMRKLPKSQRRPERPYGGHLCSQCTRILFKKSVREVLENK
jgi:large subunit ribosomal protein L34e